MDFSQTKLTKMEWESIEIPVSETEKRVLHLIQEGYGNLNVKYNDNGSLLSFMKMEYSPEIEMYLYSKYFAPIVAGWSAPVGGSAPAVGQKREKKKGSDTGGPRRAPVFAAFQPELPNIAKFKPPRKIDLLRLQNMDTNLSSGTLDTSRIFEYIQLDFCHKVLMQGAAGLAASLTPTFYLYTLLHMKKSAVVHANKYVGQLVDQLLAFAQTHASENLIRETFLHSHTIIEKNPYLLQFENRTLYDHQKKLFQLFSAQQPESPPAQ